MWKSPRIPSAKPLKLPKPLKLKLAKPPAEKYIVVVNLWLYLSSPDFFTMMGGWLQCAFGAPPLAIYHNGNRAEYIIVEFSSDVDVKSRLGAHSPCEFIKDVAWPRFYKTVKNHASVIYEYNYPVHKDPTIKFDNKLNTWPDPFSSLSPFKWGVDYPPSRLPHTFLSAANDYCALPLPRELLSMLKPRLDPPAKPPSSGYDPRSRSNPDASPEAKPPPPPKWSSDETDEQKISIGKIGKLDPYQEEENANALLRSTLDSDVKPEPDDVCVKAEYGVQHGRGQSRGTEANRYIKPEPRDEVVPGSSTMVIKGDEGEERRSPNHDWRREVKRGGKVEEESRFRDFSLRVKLENHDDDRHRLWPRHHVKHELSSPRDSPIKVKEEERKTDINRPFEKTSLPSWIKRERNMDAVFGVVSDKSERLSINGSHQFANSDSQTSRSGNVTTRFTKREYDGCGSTKGRESGNCKRRKREF